MAKKKAAQAERSLSPEQTVRAIRRTCKGPLRKGYRELINAALEKNDRVRASELDAEGREGCDQDVNDLIIKGGLDGKEHDAACPRCKQKISWRAPRF
jgi:hypothetical protein